MTIDNCEVFSLPSFAKINWALEVLGKRSDGFHELVTVFQTVSLCDELTFEASDDLSFTCDDPAMPVDESNLIIKAARALWPDGKAHIGLKKRIPSPGGLGGGSSNAAVALIGLKRLWGMKVVDGHLREIAAELGSDVPFFLHGGTAVGTGRGEIIKSTDDINEPNLLIVTPDVAVSTADAFGALNAPALTPDAQKRILSVSRNEADSFFCELKNDLEPTVFVAHPEIERVKGTLIELGASQAAMSGSGASVFARFDNKETRQAALKALDHESTWRKFAVATISRAEYREALDI